MHNMSPLGLNVQASSSSSFAAQRPASPPSPGTPPQHASYQALNGAMSALPAQRTLRQERVRHRQDDSPPDEARRETKIRKREGAQAVSRPPSQPQDRYRAIPSGISFLISAQDLAALQASSSRRIEISGTFASSDGSSMVTFVDAPLAPPPVPAGDDGDSAPMALPQAAPAAAAEQPEPEPEQEEAYVPFDPIDSTRAHRLQTKLSQMLEAGASEQSIFRQLLRPKGTLKNHLIQNRWAFTPELLVVVLRTLSTVDDDDAIQRLGHAFGRLRVLSRRYSGEFAGSGTLGREARKVIGNALGHPAIQDSVPLCRLLKFLDAANETGKPISVKRDGHFVNAGPRTQFTTASAPYGIPQALTRRMVREATEAAGGDLTAVLASAKQLGEVLVKGSSYKYTQTQNAVLSEIQRSGLAPAVKAQLKSEFNLAFEFGPDELSDAASENS